MKKLILFTVVCIFAVFSAVNAQIRIAVLPFQNMDGNMKLNIVCYNMQDSVTKILNQKDSLHQYYIIVPADSIEALLAELNIDPNNPQYPTDVWRIVKRLNIKKVVSGNFNIEANRILINAYILDSRTKLPDSDHQARDIFLPIDKYYDAVKPIIEAIIDGLIPKG